MQLRPGEPPRFQRVVCVLLALEVFIVPVVVRANNGVASPLLRLISNDPNQSPYQLELNMEQNQQQPIVTTNEISHKQQQQFEPANLILIGANGSTPPATSEGQTGVELNMSFPLYMRLLATLACLIIFTIGVCGNLLVPLVVIKTRYLRNSTNLFLINLSVADLLVLIVCMPTVLIELHSRPETWLLGEAMCKLSNFVEMLAANGSIFTILAISFERYYAICKPLKAGYKCTRLRATIIICLIWLLACILTSPILIMAKSVQTTYIDGSLVDNCILETDTYWPKMYVFVSMFAFFCLPLLVLMLVYWLISRRLIRESIAMLDSTRSALIEQQRHNSVSQTDSHSPPMSTSRRGCLHDLRKTGSLKPIASFFSSIGHYHHHHHHSAPKETSSSCSWKRAKMFAKINSAPSTRSRSPCCETQTSTSPSSEHDGLNSSFYRHLKFKKMQINKATSLDAQRANGWTRDEQFEEASLPKLADAQQEALGSGRYSWSQASCIASQSANLNPAPAHICVDGLDSSARKGSLPARLFAPNGLVGQLLNFSSITSRFAAHHTKGAGQQATVTEESEPNGHNCNRQERLMSPAKACDNDSSGQANGLRGKQTRADWFRLMTGASLPGAATVNGKRTGGAPASASPRDRPPLISSSANDQQPLGNTATHYDLQPTSNHHLNIDSSKSSRRVRKQRRALESWKQRNDSTGAFRARSKFKWAKDFSISSSTGSTYTNSTCLASETNSKSPSLHNSTRLSSSTPRPIIVHQTDAISSASRSSSPIKSSRNGSERKKIAHFQTEQVREAAECERDLIHAASRQLAATQPRPITNSTTSYSSSVSCDNISERSTSPASSASMTAPESSKSPWLESAPPTFHTQPQTRKLDYNEEAGNCATQASAANVDSCDSAIEVREYIPEARHEEEEEDELSEDCDALSTTNNNVGRTNLDKLTHKERRARHMMRSLTDDRQPYEKIKLMAIHSAMAPLAKRFDCDEHPVPVRESERGVKATASDGGRGQRNSIMATGSLVKHNSSKVNLIAMAHNLSDNFQMRRANRRSGSQPLVTNHLQVNGVSVGPSELHHAVRDISKKQQMDSRRQVVVMLAFVVACFFLLFFPYRVFTIWLILSTEAQVQSLGMETYYNLTYFSRILIYLHSAINPIAYNLISTKFRRAFMSILLCRGSATRRKFITDTHRQQQQHECKNTNLRDNKTKVNTNSAPRSPMMQHNQHW